MFPVTAPAATLALVIHIFISLVLIVDGSCQASAPSARPVFTSADPNRVLSFPADHGAHPDFQTEWWYFTGHLYESGKQAFVDDSDYGFQLTFFRRAVERRSGAASPSDQSALLSSSGQMYLAHAAVSDFRRRSFTYAERISHGALGLAGAASKRLKVWNGDWRAEAAGESLILEFAPQPFVRADAMDPARDSPLTLTLVAALNPKPVLQGVGGFSKKASCDRCASHYYSMPGMRVTGSLHQGQITSTVHGLAWMDHEFMSNALTDDQAGWDWFSLSHKDGRQVMLFTIRDKTGGLSFASGSVSSGAGTRPLSAHDFSIKVTDYWQSPRSQARYPSRWEVAIPKEQIRAELRSRLADQELVFPAAGEGKSPLTYWEGAVASTARDLLGYVEMTGYAGEMGDVL